MKVEHWEVVLKRQLRFIWLLPLIISIHMAMEYEAYNNEN